MGKGQNVNMKEMMTFFSVDAIARLVFALDINTYKDKEKEFFSNVNRLLDINSWIALLTFILPEKLFEMFRLSFFNQKAINYFSHRALEMIDFRRQQPQVQYDDFLQLLMEAETDDQENPVWRQLDREGVCVKINILKLLLIGK